MGYVLIGIALMAAGVAVPSLQRVLRGLPASNQDWHYF